MTMCYNLMMMVISHDKTKMRMMMKIALTTCPNKDWTKTTPSLGHLWQWWWWLWWRWCWCRWWWWWWWWWCSWWWWRRCWNWPLYILLAEQFCWLCQFGKWWRWRWWGWWWCLWWCSWWWGWRQWWCWNWPLYILLAEQFCWLGQFGKCSRCDGTLLLSNWLHAAMMMIQMMQMMMMKMMVVVVVLKSASIFCWLGPVWQMLTLLFCCQIDSTLRPAHQKVRMRRVRKYNNNEIQLAIFSPLNPSAYINRNFHSCRIYTFHARPITEKR